MQKLIIKFNGGEKASRNNPECYNNQKEINSVRKLCFPQKNLYVQIAYFSSGISKKLKNLLKIVSSGDIATNGKTGYLLRITQRKSQEALKKWNQRTGGLECEDI